MADGEAVWRYYLFALGLIALGQRPRAQKVRWIAFIVAATLLVLIYHLATTKMPLLGNV